jgi:hypothetical protein
MRPASGLLLLLLIAACAVRDDLPADAGTVRADPKPAAAQSVARGETQVLLRSFSADGREIRGAACELDSSLFSAEAVTPARVLVPYYGAASPPVSVTCSGAGLGGREVLSIATVGSGGGVAWPSVGVSVNSDGGVGVGLGLGYYGGRTGYSETAYRYPPANITLR